MTMLRSIPALPVQDVAAAAAFYRDRLGFEVTFAEPDFAIVRRDGVELNLWAASDKRWRSRSLESGHPVRSGAESFIAGTASCRIELDSAAAIDELHDEVRNAGALHPTDSGSAVETDYGTREFAALDLEGNLLTYFTRLA